MWFSFLSKFHHLSIISPFVSISFFSPTHVRGFSLKDGFTSFPQIAPLNAKTLASHLIENNSLVLIVDFFVAELAKIPRSNRAFLV